MNRSATIFIVSYSIDIACALGILILVFFYYQHDNFVYSFLTLIALIAPCSFIAAWNFDSPWHKIFKFKRG
jgi:hypothetical protein